MITYSIIQMLVSIVGLIFAIPTAIFGEATIANIPVIGQAVSSTLITVITTWNAFLVTFPYAELPWHIFLGLVLVFEPLLLLAKFFLGHRLPANI